MRCQGGEELRKIFLKRGSQAQPGWERQGLERGERERGGGGAIGGKQVCGQGLRLGIESRRDRGRGLAGEGVGIIGRVQVVIILEVGGQEEVGAEGFEGDVQAAAGLGEQGRIGREGGLFGVTGGCGIGFENAGGALRDRDDRAFPGRRGVRGQRAAGFWPRACPARERIAGEHVNAVEEDLGGEAAARTIRALRRRHRRRIGPGRHRRKPAQIRVRQEFPQPKSRAKVTLDGDQLAAGPVQPPPAKCSRS